MSADTLTVPCPGVLDSLASGRKAKPHAAGVARRVDGWVVACTLGCLLALVREAWGSHVSSIRTGDGWSVRHMGRDGWAVGLSVVGITQCETEAEALVAALEAAPRREAS